MRLKFVSIFFLIAAIDNDESLAKLKKVFTTKKTPAKPGFLY